VPKSDPRWSPTKRLYFDPQGRVQPRRKYDDARLQSFGWKNKADFDTRFLPRVGERKNRGYRRWAEAGIRTGKISEKDVRKMDSEFNRLFLAMRDDDFDTDPDGSFADFLLFIGLRRPDVDAPVGGGETGYA
jgi:hypothetical protein